MNCTSCGHALSDHDCWGPNSGVCAIGECPCIRYVGPRPTTSPERCSFCDKTRREVAKLIARETSDAGGPAICDECISICADLLLHDKRR